MIKGTVRDYEFTKFVESPTRPGKPAIEVTGNVTIGSTVSNSYNNIYSEVSSVPSGILTTISTYTVPVLKVGFLQRIELGGDNAASYEIYLNSSLIDKRFTSVTALYSSCNFESGLAKGMKMFAGDVLEVKVIHSRPSAGQFTTRLQVVEE